MTLVLILTGWAWQTLAMSSQEAPYSMARTASLIISPAPCVEKNHTGNF